MKIRATSFNEQFIAKCRRAMERAVRNSVAWKAKGQAYVTNRHGKVMLRVDYEYGRHPAFQFWRGNHDVTTIALAGVTRPRSETCADCMN